MKFSHLCLEQSMTLTLDGCYSRCTFIRTYNCKNIKKKNLKCMINQLSSEDSWISEFEITRTAKRNYHRTKLQDLAVWHVTCGYYDSIKANFFICRYFILQVWSINFLISIKTSIIMHVLWLQTNNSVKQLKAQRSTGEYSQKLVLTSWMRSQKHLWATHFIKQ